MPSPPKVAVHNAETSTAQAVTCETSAPPAAPWRKPRLCVYGDVRQLTMGVSPGLGESGNELTRHT